MRIDLPGVNAVRRRLASGERRTYYYHRRTGIRLPDDPASPQFVARLAQLNGETAKDDPKAGTLEALIVAYRASSEWRELSEGSRKDYARYLDALREMWGELPVAGFERRNVRSLRETFADRPRTANYYVQVFRRLMSLAVDMGWRGDNPASRPKLLKTGPGHKPWPEAAIEVFRAKAPAEMATALMLGLYTGQRESDVVAMTWTAYRDGAIEIVQRKTGAEIWIPAHAELRAHLDALRRRSPVILLSATGRPFRVDHFRHRFHEAVMACGLSGLTFHGLRKTATERLAEAGCTDREIMAITGHRTHAMVTRYLDRTARKERARSAIRKLEKNGP